MDKFALLTIRSSIDEDEVLNLTTKLLSPKSIVPLSNDGERHLY